MIMEEKIRELLREEYPDLDFTASDALVDDGILDSLTVTGIVTMLTMELGIEIPYEEITAENFNSVAAMASLAEDLMV